jgi:hypothetical protein
VRKHDNITIYAYWLYCYNSHLVLFVCMPPHYKLPYLSLCPCVILDLIATLILENRRRPNDETSSSKEKVVSDIYFYHNHYHHHHHHPQGISHSGLLHLHRCCSLWPSCILSASWYVFIHKIEIVCLVHP